ncbi:MAG TPA: hypothetical protein VL947_01175 [Cytophagales bacterium]|nr:hypothetical protein [Cytophagales bacterium]
MKKKDIPKGRPAVTHIETPATSKTNYFNYAVLVFAYSFVLFILFKTQIGKLSFGKVKQNYEEYKAFKDTNRLETLYAYKNGEDFIICNYIKTHTDADKDVLLLPSRPYLALFKKDYNHPLMAASKFYYFGAKLRFVRYGEPGYEKATIALGLDSNGDVIPVKLDTEEKRQLLFEKFKSNLPLN